MKRTILFAAFFALALLVGRDAHAQNQIGINVGYNLDAEEFFAGAQFRAQPASLPVIINPSIETYFIENFTWLQIDINALYPFGIDNQAFTPYAGAGLGINFLKPENGDSRTDAGLNLIAGATFGFNRIQPFAEARINIDDGTNVGLRGGVLFTL